MDKKTLQSILSKSFELASWQKLLADVFGVKRFLNTPLPIPLPNKDKAEAAFEIGSFNTVDDRIIGLYLVKVKPEVWLERNKVGLRELLRKIYKYDVDGALIVFEQGSKWRLSFVSDIKILNNEGEVIKQVTEPKRYTYLLGENEKIRTPVERLAKIVGKQLYLNDILNAFSVEALNEEFYKIIQAFFYDLVGGKIGKGNKTTDFGSGSLRLPVADRNIRQEFVVRLIGRTVFCWFLKMKKSDSEAALLPEDLLSSAAVRNNPNYYHSVLERLFFQTLNTPMADRLSNLPKGAEMVPFLNGGLFEPNADDFYSSKENDGESIVSDNWFLAFFVELEKYNFTIDENSVAEVEVSVDPEMLGRIFENLLAEIDPNSGETARKSTGSFYTPREIVDYMATESLVQYIHNKTQLEFDKIRPLFKMLEGENIQFTSTEVYTILEALDSIKILDPACGSGAFPIGVLQKIVQALQKIDSEAIWWKKRQVDRVNNAVVKKQLKEKLESSGVEYARKFGVIQHSLYGVDIQPIAAEISKLRCFLSLIVDEKIDDKKPNRGIETLPNLEFKFVTADTLQTLPETNGQAQLNREGKKSSAELEVYLEEIRQDYIQSYGEDKRLLKEKFKHIQKQLSDQQDLFGSIKDNRYNKISNWNPFNHDRSEWFDPKWMFGVEKFDIVIGNPPYIKEYTNRSAFDGLHDKKYYQGKMDIWYYFACHLLDYITGVGNLAFIATNNWVTNSGASKLREKIVTDGKIIRLIDFGNTKVFSSADIQTMILIIENRNKPDIYEFSHKYITGNTAGLKDAINMLEEIPYGKYSIATPIFDRSALKGKNFVFSSSEDDRLLDRIKAKQNFVLDERDEIAQGIVPNPDVVNVRNIEKIANVRIEKENIRVGDGVFVVDRGTFNDLSEVEKKYIKPVYEPYLVKKYSIQNNDKEIIYITKKNFKNDCQTLVEHLSKYREIMDDRRENLQGRLLFYHLHWARDEYFFEQGAKILAVRKCAKPTFSYTENEAYVMMSFNVIRSNRINLKYLSALFNSGLVEYWLRHKGKMQGFNFQIDKEPLLEIPIFKPDATEPFEILVDYILFLLSVKEKINDQVSNAHIAQIFEETIDAMVMELYFKKDFDQADIEFVKFADRDFESIKDKDREEAKAIIRAAYQKLREKDNEIRNNLKLMDIKLSDIVMPIKTAGK